MAILPMNIYAGFRYGNKTNKIVNYYFSIAYILFFSLLVCELAHLNIGFKYHLVVPYVLLGYVTEVSVLGYALSKKFQLVHNELQSAKERALTENFRLVQSQNQLLEKKVRERTSELLEKTAILERQNFEIQESQKIIVANKHNIESQNLLLSKQNEQLRALNEEKTNLIGIVSHDLKTPISHIQGFASILKRELTGLSREQSGFLERIIECTKRLSTMINRILSAEILECVQYDIKSETVDINGLLSEMAQAFKIQAEIKRITIHLTGVDRNDNLYVIADKGYLYQILENLISNAIKFSPLKRNVYINSYLGEEGAVCVSIKDEGPGIEDSDKSKLFGKFQRLTALPIGNEKSTGLGLSIAKKFIELMNGKIWCESEPGKGANFIIQLPRSLATESNDVPIVMAGQHRV